MDTKKLIKKLKKSGIKFEKGLTEKHITKLENLCDFKFPTEIKNFLSIAVPVGDLFYNYNDLSKQNIQRINEFQNRIEESFLFDIENNNLLECFRKDFSEYQNDNELKDKIFEYLHKSKKLVPFYGHRCFISGMNNSPILSFQQPSDTIFYGSCLEEYLINEFISKTWNVGEISKDFEKTGIWHDLVW